MEFFKVEVKAAPSAPLSYSRTIQAPNLGAAITYAKNHEWGTKGTFWALYHTWIPILNEDGEHVVTYRSDSASSLITFGNVE